jgi:uncharacterized membrane protein
MSQRLATSCLTAMGGAFWTFASSVRTTTLGVARSVTTKYSCITAAEIFTLSFVFGPIIWIAVSFWIVVRQVKRSSLRNGVFMPAALIQILLISLPFFHHNLSLGEAGLTEFTSCPNNQEYCDAFFKVEALRARFVFHLITAFWVGVAVWLLTFLFKPPQADVSQ